MSAYAARLKTEMKPMLDELRELNELDSPNDEQKTDIDRITLNLAAKKTEYDKAIERSQKALQAETMYGAMDDPVSGARAVYDPPIHAGGTAVAGPEIKAVSSYFIESREFKAPRPGPTNIMASVPVAALYPFLERKAPYIPGNLEMAGPNLRVIAPAQLAQAFPFLAMLNTVPWNEISVPYLPLVFTNNAAEVDIGGPKPESTNLGDILSVMMRTVAHWKEVPRQILRYVPRLRTTIDQELRWGVLSRMQASVINGTGTGSAMLGIVPQVTQSATGDGLMEQIFNAIATVETAGGQVDAIVMHPNDYALLAWTEYSSGVYNPLLAGARFGQYTIVKSSAIVAGTALVGDFSQAVTLFVGEEANVRATEALGFKNNIVTILAEMDAVVLVERPWFLVKCPGPTIPVVLPFASGAAPDAGSETPAGRRARA